MFIGGAEKKEVRVAAGVVVVDKLEEVAMCRLSV
jgi:hypothetical protein